mgnify:CR=1 FL=1
MKIEVIKFDENWNAVFGVQGTGSDRVFKDKERAGEIFSKAVNSIKTSKK